MEGEAGEDGGEEAEALAAWARTAGSLQPDGTRVPARRCQVGFCVGVRAAMRRPWVGGSTSLLLVIASCQARIWRAGTGRQFTSGPVAPAGPLLFGEQRSRALTLLHA